MFEIRTTIELIGTCGGTEGKVLGSEELLTGVKDDGTPEDGTIGDFETMLEDLLHEFKDQIQGFKPLRDFLPNSELGDGFVLADDDPDNVYRLVKVGPVNWDTGAGLNIMHDFEVWTWDLDLDVKVKRVDIDS